MPTYPISVLTLIKQKVLTSFLPIQNLKLQMKNPKTKTILKKKLNIALPTHFLHEKTINQLLNLMLLICSLYI